MNAVYILNMEAIFPCETPDYLSTATYRTQLFTGRDVMQKTER
jgi:hypothetical protein